MDILWDYRVRLKRLAGTPGRWYLLAGAAVLGLSTVAWSLVVARLQQGNADQLVDGFLFTNAATFQQAQFPAEHTLLLKWPLFWALGALQNTPWAYMVGTVALCLATVGLYAYVLFRIERRPVVLGTLYLSLALVLMLVPAQVLGGVTSPLSMAMITGRNIEYMLYIAGLALLLPSGRAYAWGRWSAAALLLGSLFASDQLFVVCSLGGALLLVLSGYVRRSRVLTGLGWAWLGVSGVSVALAWLVLAVLRRVTGIVAGSADIQGHITTLAGMQNAGAYGLRAVLPNFGIHVNFGWIGVLPVLLNVGTLGAIVYAWYVLVRRGVRRSAPPGRAELLAALLGLSAFAVFAVYVVIGHAVAADARYLTITFFAGFVALAAYSRSVRINPRLLYGGGAVLCVGLVLGLVGLARHATQVRANDMLRARNQRVVRALADHPVEVLVGNYWRVVPIKALTKQTSQHILPLGSCLQPRQSLVSGAWKQDLYTHSFAYLLSVQPDGTPFGRCSLQTLVLVYGQPSSVVRIAGTARSPMELLLFYNNGGAKLRGKETAPPMPVFGAPTEGMARPTGSTITPLTDPS